MKVRVILSSIIVLLLSVSCVNAEQGSMMEQSTEKDTSTAVEIGNKICPVSGEEIGGAMGPGAQYEYKGKIYNFCCAGCVAMFKKDPEKYVKVVGKQMGSSMEMGEENEHAGHHHMMGEKDEYMMTGMENDHSMMKDHQEMSMPDKAEIKEIDLEAYQFSYDPDTITVNKGDVVRIHATSRDVPHGIYIKEYGINDKVEKCGTPQFLDQ